MNTATDAGVVAQLPRGRIDSEQQEAIVKLDPVRERLEELEHLYAESIEAQDSFSEAIKVTAEASGLLAKSLRKFIVARVQEKTDERQRECEQLAFLFEELTT